MAAHADIVTVPTPTRASVELHNSPQPPPPAIPDCGICGQPHRCHSPHLKSWCDDCLPLRTAVPS
jgi:hypothetical protein